MLVERIVDSGLVPERVLRAGIRGICALRLREQRDADTGRFIADLKRSDVAIETQAANTQHYEVPAAFFTRVLGPHLKYSSCYWSDGTRTLGDAEVAMLKLTADRAGLADGQDILDLGCGWGSMSLYAAQAFPNSRITGVSNSASQRAFIEGRARERGLTNLTILTHDVRTLTLPAASFDRVVSVEMFEHMRNYQRLLATIRTWLRPAGSLFVHVFAHARHAYPFDDNGASDWMAREFFTGGLMPSVALFRSFQDDLRITDEWQLSGTHYAKTAEAWHTNLLRERTAVEHMLGKKQFCRWRVFFLACAELFGFREGREWLVAHYRFAPR